MTVRIKVTSRWLGGGVLLLAALGVIALRLMPLHRPLEYMIAGTAATALALAIAFGVVQMARA